MEIHVIDPPAPIVLPQEIVGVSAGDPVVEALIASATAEIDGPLGYLGRALGPQTIAVTFDGRQCGPVLLPCPPIISILSVNYKDGDGNDHEIETSDYIYSAGLFRLYAGIPHPVTVTYRAGYQDDKTGPLPANVKRAVILRTLYLRSISADNLFLKSVEVDGVGRREYIVSDQAGKAIDGSIANLLRGLKVPRL